MNWFKLLIKTFKTIKLKPSTTNFESKESLV